MKKNIAAAATVETERVYDIYDSSCCKNFFAGSQSVGYHICHGGKFSRRENA
jgi:hypothetical protein